MQKTRKTQVKSFNKEMRSGEYMKFQHLFKELDYGMDLHTNTFFLTSEISPESLYETLARLNLLSKVSASPINLNVSSFGGDVYSMFGIHDYIRILPMKVNTICIGTAMSAAAFLLASGTGERVATKNSTVMFHEFSSSIDGKTKSLEVNISHVKKLQLRMEDLLGEYTKKSASFWRSHLKEDFFLTAEECLAFGVIDKII